MFCSSSIVAQENTQANAGNEDFWWPPMLEKDRLLIMPWSSAAGLPHDDVAGLARVRRIQDSAGALLGFAGWAPRSWWRGKVISVFEIPDASLLMTIHRPWGLMRMWQVRDAEERRVGSVYRDVALDGDGNLLTHLQKPKPNRPQKFLTRFHGELGSLEWLDDGSSRLSISHTVDPFARMIVVASVLTMPPMPQIHG
jgi:hypothetical protein